MNSPQIVRLTRGQHQKFVLASLSMPAGETLEVMWGSPQATWHIDIVHELADAGHVVVNVLGGGRVYVNSKTKEVHFWDTSSRYGAAPAETVTSLLKETYPGYQVFENSAPLSAQKLARR